MNTGTIVVIAEAVCRFNKVIDALPNSIYAHGARQALKRTTDDRRATSDDE